MDRGRNVCGDWNPRPPLVKTTQRNDHEDPYRSSKCYLQTRQKQDLKLLNFQSRQKLWVQEHTTPHRVKGTFAQLRVFTQETSTSDKTIFSKKLFIITKVFHSHVGKPHF